MVLVGASFFTNAVFVIFPWCYVGELQPEDSLRQRIWKDWQVQYL